MMKLFVWEDVLYGWSGGMITALALTKEDAIKLALKQEGDGLVVKDMRNVKPTVINLTGCTLKRPKLWIVWGGD